MAIITISLLLANVIRAQETETIKIKEITTVSEKPEKESPSLHYLELGVRLLPTFSSLSVQTYNGDVIQGKATMSMGYGAVLGLNLSKNVGVQGEVNYNKISQKYKDQNLERQVHVDYINIPILLSLNTDKSQMVNLNLVAGPQFGINVGSSTSVNGSRETDTLRAVVAVKQNDFGFAYGAGLETMLNPDHSIRLDLGFRGFYGLVDIDDKSSGDTFNVIVRASSGTNWSYEFCSNINSCIVPSFP